MESRFQSAETNQDAEWTSEALIGSLAVENAAVETMERREDEAVEIVMALSEAEKVEILGRAVAEELQQRRKMFIAAFIGFVSYAVALRLIMAVIIHRMGWEAWREWLLTPGNLVPYTVLTMGLPICFLMISGRRSAKRRPRHRSRRTTEELLKSRDIRSVGPLVDSMSLEAGRRRRYIIDALINLLPQLRADQADLLNAAQQARLCRVLSHDVEDPLYKDVLDLFRVPPERALQFRLAILKALAQVGDSQALLVVERLAKREGKTERQKCVQQAAKDCLPFLQARSEQIRAPQTLLRASSVAETGSATLLRSVTEPVPTDPQQLLRANNPSPGGVMPN